jgi:hypothetical protein
VQFYLVIWLVVVLGVVGVKSALVTTMEGYDPLITGEIPDEGEVTEYHIMYLHEILNPVTTG